MQFNIVCIEHIPGKKNEAPDALSRFRKDIYKNSQRLDAHRLDPLQLQDRYEPRCVVDTTLISVVEPRHPPRLIRHLRVSLKSTFHLARRHVRRRRFLCRPKM